MVDTTDIEKKSLEAHVELCAERYRYLEEKLETVEETVVKLKSVIDEIHSMIHEMKDKRNDQLISWGIGIIAALVGTVGYLFTHYVLK
jgi:hypothetical protein